MRLPRPLALGASRLRGVLRPSLVAVLLAVLTAASALAQGTVTTEPEAFRESDAVTLTFDATGTPLEGFEGDVYAYTATTTADGDQWTCEQASFGTNTEELLMTRAEGEANVYTLLIEPSVRAFYLDNADNEGAACDLDEGERMATINFVFRAGDGSAQSSDFLLDVLPPLAEAQPPEIRENRPTSIFFYAEGTPLEGFEGDVYAYTATSTESGDRGDGDQWTCEQAPFGTNTEELLMTRVETDVYRLDIEPTVRAFYLDNADNEGAACNLDEGEFMDTINFVFRAGDGSAQSSDVLLEVLDPAYTETEATADEPTPVREDDPVALLFDINNAERQDDLLGFMGDVYLFTGILTTASPDGWTCIQSASFGDDLERLRVERTGMDQYRFEIDDLRTFYQEGAEAVGRDCALGPDDQITQLNLILRSNEAGQTEDLFVPVLAPVSGEPSLSFELLTPEAPSALYPAFAGDGQPLRIEAAAALGGGATLDGVSVFVDGIEVADGITVEDDTLRADVPLGAPGPHDVRVAASANGGALTEEVTFEAFQVGPITEAPVPEGLRDGINYGADGTSATLVLHAPMKDFAFLIGPFSGWDASNDFLMNVANEGTPDERYWLTLDGLTAGDETPVQYFVDGEIRVSDPYAEKVLSFNDQFIDEATYPDLMAYPDGETEHLITLLQPGKPAFNFSDFEAPAEEDLVIYELLIRDFIEAHDYQTMIDTLDYFVDLGVTALELMPVSEFDGNESWGYNPNHYFAPDKYYGPEEDLKRFIDAAHQRGLAVILDVVYNQQTGQAPFVRLYNDGAFGPPTDDNPWVNREARHPFNVFYDNNHETEVTQAWLDRANEHWLTEYNVDGFRFDLSKGFTQGPNDQGYGDDVGAWSSFDAERVALLKRMADAMWAVNDDAYVILEHFADNREEQELTAYRRDEGLGMMVWQNLHGPYNQLSMGYASNSDISNSHAANRGLPVTGAVSYMESHDEQWMMYNNRAFGNASEDGTYDVKALATALDRQKLAGAFFFTVPGPRMMWQFGELGYGFGESGEQCLRGGGGEGCDGTDAPGRTANKPIRWDYLDDADRVELRDTWAAMLRLRAEHDVFTSTTTDVTFAGGPDGAFTRSLVLDGDALDVVVIGNFDVTTQNAAATFTETGTWYDVFNGGAEITLARPDTAFAFRPGEFRVYTSEPVETPPAGLVPYAGEAPLPAVFTAPEVVTASVSQSFGDSTLGTPANYRLVALPGLTSRNVSADVPGVAGRDWQAYWDNGASSDFLEAFVYTDSTFFYQPGNGFWLISSRGRTVNETTDAVALTSSGTATIPLHDGWNIISNPFGEDMPWRHVQELSGTAQPLWGWDGSFTQRATFRSAASGEAFYFLNDQGLSSLTLAHPGSPEALRLDGITPTLPRALALAVLRDDGTPASLVRVGLADEATDARDRFDQPAPAAFPEATTLRLTSASLTTSARAAKNAALLRRAAFAGEYRAANAPGHVFDLTLTTDARGPVTLQASALDAVKGLEVRLVDTATGEVFDLRDEAIATLAARSTDGPRALRLVVGTAAFVETALDDVAPATFDVAPAYPNPFRSKATLGYALPEDAHVTVEVFDVLGRRVATLVDGPQTAGSHEVVFRPQGLASGAYFYRVTAGDQTKTGRVVLVR